MVGLLLIGQAPARSEAMTRGRRIADWPYTCYTIIHSAYVERGEQRAFWDNFIYKHCCVFGLLPEGFSVTFREI